MSTKKGNENRPVFVVDGARTPFLKWRSVPGPFSASDLAVAAGKPLLLRQPFEPDALDEVILGCVMQGAEEQNIARVVSMRLGCGKKVPAFSVHRNCASGMQSIFNAAQNIATGRSNLVLAGGAEAMSRAPVMHSEKFVAWLGAWNKAKSIDVKLKSLLKLRPSHLIPVIGLLKGLSDPFTGLDMGQTAEIVSHRFHISRSEMDLFSVESHQRLARAQDEGTLEEIEVIYDRNGRIYDQDDGIRRDTNVGKLAGLKSTFDRQFGNVTAGNSAQVTDGAALLVLASEEAVKKYNLPVLGEVVDCEWAGVDPSEMGLGPAHAIPALMKRLRLKPETVDYWEINEAFAGQVLACLAAMKDENYCRSELGLTGAFGEIHHGNLNIDGGAISIGHPVGASGARLVLHLLHVLKRTNTKRGVASLCIGGGQGGAMLLERKPEK